MRSVKIEAIIAQIKANSKDAEMAGKLCEELMSSNGIPSLIDIPNDSITDSCRFGAFTLIRTKADGIIFKSTGYRLVVRPYIKSLYGQLSFIMDKKKEYDAGTLSDEEKELFDSYTSITISILALPLEAFTEDEYLFDLAKDIIKRKQAYYARLEKRAANFTPTQEDVIADDEFEATMSMMEEEKQNEQD